MATLDDVITDAKATGEFEGSVEDIKAARVMLKGAPEVIATDASCGAKTQLTKLVLDRGISFNSVVQTIIDGDESEGSEKPKEDNHNAMSDEETDEKEEHCKSGFYMSRRKIAGRRLIMFAQRKVEKEDDIDTDFIDPLNLMIITRPNTGKVRLLILTQRKTEQEDGTDTDLIFFFSTLYRTHVKCKAVK